MAYQVSIDKTKFLAKIEYAAFFKLRQAAQKKAAQLVDKKKQEFLQEFIEHPVTQEILAGPSQNAGVSGQNGNLASFLGFDEGSEQTAIKDLYDYLSSHIKLRDYFNYDKTSKTFNFKMSAPTIDDIKGITELSKYASDDNGWGEGRSWATSIERGIPGLAYYKFSNDPKILKANSRSGSGAQRKNQIHPGASYKPRRYLTDLLKLLSK